MRFAFVLGLITLSAGCADSPLANTLASADAEVASQTPSAQPTATSRDAALAQVDAAQQPPWQGVPCEVAALIDKHCGFCHGDKPLYGAPMPLRSYQDFQALSVRDGKTPVHQQVAKRLHLESDPMPPSNRPRIAPADLAILDDYLAHGAPRGETCSTLPVHEDTVEPPFDWTQCDYDFELRAHGAQTVVDDTGYAVPLQDDHYECFNFAVPWDVDVHGIRFEPLVDQPRVVHHWLLYEMSSIGAPAVGSHGPCTLNRTFLATWTPGAQADNLPDDVGMQMPAPTSMLQLELHYNNVRRIEGVLDRSGVRVCATKKLREHSAQVHKVGSSDITLPPGQTTKVVNTCTVASAIGDAHVISAFPHMHQLGRHFKTTVTRSDGSVEVLTDTPFDFRYQGYVPTPFVIHQGDVITTTCTFENTTGEVVKSGEGTSEEMCYNHLLAWPPRSIASVPFGKDCIGLIPSGLH